MRVTGKKRLQNSTNILESDFYFSNLFSRPAPQVERPVWMDDPRGAGKRADGLPKDFPRNDANGKTGWTFGF